MSEHAVYAPSSAHRWVACTASATAIAALPEQESGEEAEQGTAAHDEIERCLSPWCETRGHDGMNEFPVNPDHPAAYGVALLIDFVKKLPPGRVWIEQRVRLTDDIWGRCDVAHWDAASLTLTIVDYKNGFVGVDAEENEQLQIYAAASIYTHNLPAKWIRLAVVQPNDFRPVPRVKQWVTDAASLYAFASRVAAIPNGPLTFVAGEQCRYCPVFGRCPASQDVLVRLGAMLAHPAADVPPSLVAIFTACRKPVEDWFKAMDKAATKVAMAGKVPVGMKLVTITKHRAWLDEAWARQAIAAQLGVDALKPPSPSQAEEAGMPADVVETLSARPEGGYALALESDSRKPWAPKSVEKMFAGVTNATAK